MNLFLFKIYQFLKFRNRKFAKNPNIIFKELNESQYWTREKLEEYQLKKINNLLLLAKESSPYYAEKYKNISLPLSNIEEFRNAIPTISKDEIMENLKGVRTKNFSNQYHHTTSGTTGNPLTAYISGMTESVREACHIRFHDWWGINQNDQNIYIAIIKSGGRKSLISKIKKYIRGRHDIDVFDLSEKTILRYFSEIEKFKPSYIRGYKSALLELTKLMDLKNLRFKNFKLKAAIVTSEVLYDNERKFIEGVLGCKLANEYGSVEAGLYANECPYGSMHINEEAVYIHTNSENEAIVTELDNDSMPLINYKNDDLVLISENNCECGRTSRVIDEVKGRVTGYVIRPDGSKINQIIINRILMQLDKGEFNNTVRKFQVIQKGQTFVVKIEPLENFRKGCKDFISKRLYEEIGKDINIEFEIVDKIERDKSGKYRIFKNEG